MIATNAGAVGTLNIGAGAGNPAAAPGTLTAPSLAFGAGTGTLNFNHTSGTYVFEPAISGTGTVNVLAGTTTLTGANSYSGATNVSAGTLRAGAPNTFSPNSAVTVASGGTLDLTGFDQTLPGLTMPAVTWARADRRNRDGDRLRWPGTTPPAATRVEHSPRRRRLALRPVGIDGGTAWARPG